jgi:hypothetical protein
MSHLPRAVPRTVAAGCPAPGITINCMSRRALPPTSIVNSVHVPLARRTADQLQANADELRRMAATASTADVAKALLTLADRYAALAEQRRTGANL